MRKKIIIEIVQNNLGLTNVFSLKPMTKGNNRRKQFALAPSSFDNVIEKGNKKIIKSAVYKITKFVFFI